MENTKTTEQIQRSFCSYRLDEDHEILCKQIRDAARQFAHMINICAPDSREKSLALTKLEEAMMWANAAISREG